MVSPAVLARAVNGDTTAFDSVLSSRHSDLSIAALDTVLILRPAAVAHVLSEYLEGALTARKAQAWASFVRRGHTDNVDDRPFTPVSIEYDPDFEDQIVEAVFRMDELGDIVDGTIDRAEGLRLISALVEVPSTASQ